MNRINSIREKLLYLLFFFCISFNTVYFGPNVLRLNASRIILILIVFFSIISLVLSGRITLTNTIQRNFYFFLILWIVYGFFISICESIDISISYRYIIQLLLFSFVYITIIDLIKNTESLFEKCINAYICGVVVNNIFAWYELITSNYLFLVSNESIDYYIRHNYAITFYANPNNLCTVLSIGCLLCVIKFYITNKKAVKVGLLILVVSSILIMLRDYSEANIIGFVLGSVIFYVFRRNSITKLKPVQVIGICIGCIAAIFVIDQVFSFMMSYLIRTSSMIGVSDSTLGSRIGYSRNAINNMLNKNFLGIGLGNSKYYSLWAIGEVGNVHNWFTEIFVDTGIFIFLFYMYFYVSVIIRAFRNFYHKQTNFSLISLGCFSIMVSFFIINISSSSLLPSDFMWCVFALIYAHMFSNVENIRLPILAE